MQRAKCVTLLVLLLSCACALVAPPAPTPQPTPRPTSTPTPAPTPTPVPLGTGPLSANGAELVDVAGRPVRLTGVNWSGMESSSFAPFGLASRSLDDILDQIAAVGFNTLRLPFSNQLLEPGTRPSNINLLLNPQLKDVSGLELLDRVVDGARQRGLRVILDRHYPSAGWLTDLWYIPQVSEARWVEDWVMLARRYRSNEAVIGADLTNEPHGAATWGDDSPGTDWRLAAERAGNAILQANPDWLIIVEGIQQSSGTAYWWGGNLRGAGWAPVRLVNPQRLVYSAHDYGPSISWQTWFQGPDFASNLPQVWSTNWAYLQQGGIAPVLVGEFGGRSTGQDIEGVWQRSLITFLEQGGYSYMYWVWNPDGWTGGVLLDDRGTVDQNKLALLAPGPLLGSRQMSALTPIPAPTTLVTAADRR